MLLLYILPTYILFSYIILLLIYLMITEMGGRCQGFLGGKWEMGKFWVYWLLGVSVLKQGRKQHSEQLSGHLLAGEMERSGKGPDSAICDALFGTDIPSSQHKDYDFGGTDKHL